MRTWTAMALAVCFVFMAAPAATAQDAVYAEDFDSCAAPDGHRTGEARWADTNAARGCLAEISSEYAQSGKQSMRLYDGHAKQRAEITKAIAFPSSGAVTGYVMVPSKVGGKENNPASYGSIRIRPKKGSPVVLLGFAGGKDAVDVTCLQEGKLKKVATLKFLVQHDVWHAWKIEWTWDGQSDKATAKVTFGDQTTQALSYDAQALSQLRLIAGWGKPDDMNVFFDSIKVVGAAN